MGLVSSSVVIAYATDFTDPWSATVKKFFPASIVGSKYVSVEDTDEFIGLVRRMDPSVTVPAAYQTFLDRQKNEVLLQKLGLRIPSDAVTDEFNFYSRGDSAALTQLLAAYFDGSQKKFIDNVVYPEVVEAKLRIYYNSQVSLNADAWTHAKALLAQIDAGQKFEDLAKTESADQQSAQFGGDMGFFEHGQVLPELENQIVIAKMGVVDQNIIPTRDGLEIIYPIEESEQNGVKSWHAKHILIQTTGFEDWLAGQIVSVSVKTIKKY